MDDLSVEYEVKNQKGYLPSSVFDVQNLRGPKPPRILAGEFLSPSELDTAVSDSNARGLSVSEHLNGLVRERIHKRAQDVVAERRKKEDEDDPFHLAEHEPHD